MNSPVTSTKKMSNGYFRLVHLSDPHLTSLENVDWHELLNKRILGYLSWRTRRRYIHRKEILNRLEDDLKINNPAHLIVSGDLTHIGTPSECQEARQWLEALEIPENLTVIPGNHDCYAPADWDKTIGLWEPFMSGDKAEPGAGRGIFPSLRIREKIALIGLCTALPTAPFLASGKLNEEQLDGLETILQSTAGMGLFRIVILHHGPVTGLTSRRRGLVDIKSFQSVIKKYGAELVIHGHGHKTVVNKIDHQRFSIPVIGVPSASALYHEHGSRAGYNIYDIDMHSSPWVIHIRERRFDPGENIFTTSNEYQFKLPCSRA